MFKIALNAGHGYYTAGKRCLKALDANETREWVLNARICDKVQEKLKEYMGYEIIRLDDTTGMEDVPLRTRTDKANNFKADFYLAIHHNAGIAGSSGGGIVSIVYTSAGDKSVEWQKALYDSLVEHTGLKGNRSTPLAKMNLHEVRESSMPAVLLELGFMDSKTDVPIILSEDFADKCAAAIVEVLATKGGLKKLVTQPSKETDNIADAYATDAVKWAIDNGILRGDSNGNYKLHSNISRQDMIVFLYRTMQ